MLGFVGVCVVVSMEVMVCRVRWGVLGVVGGGGMSEVVVWVGGGVGGCVFGCVGVCG